MNGRIILFAALISASSMANATIATWNFAGTIDSIVDSSFETTENPYTGRFFVGDQWQATLVVDLDSPATPQSGLGSHAGAILDGSLTVLSNNVTFDMWASGYIDLAYDSTFPHVTMAYSSVSDGYNLVDFRFFDWATAVPQTLTELATSFDLAQIGDPRVTVAAGSGPTHTINFGLSEASVSLSAPVPVPASLGLLAVGLLGLVCLSRRGGLAAQQQPHRRRLAFA